MFPCVCQVCVYTQESHVAEYFDTAPEKNCFDYTLPHKDNMPSQCGYMHMHMYQVPHMHMYQVP